MQELKSNKDKELKLDSELLTKAVVRLIKQDISNRYEETKEVTDEDWEFCEKIDWHPVDELPPKPEHVEELKRALKETPIGHEASAKFLESLK